MTSHNAHINRNNNKNSKKQDLGKTNKNNNKKEVRPIFFYLIIVFLFANLILLFSSLKFDYLYFYKEIVFVSLVLGLGFVLKRYFRVFAVLLGGLFYIEFLVFNYNYMFIFGISIILGILGLHFIKHELNIPQFIYSLIPILILAHIIWFNVLPFGFDGSWTLDVGAKDDMDPKADLYIIDNDKVLSDRWSLGDKTWREFKKDGSFQIGFNTPVYLENKTVEISMEYEATSPIYINGELFYDPAWGSSVELMNEGEVYVYGADVFNLTRDYENVDLDLFLNVTNSSSLESYVEDKYGALDSEEETGNERVENSSVLNVSALESLKVVMVSFVNGSNVSFGVENVTVYKEVNQGACEEGYMENMYKSCVLAVPEVLRVDVVNKSVVLKDFVSDSGVSYENISSVMLGNGEVVKLEDYYVNLNNKEGGMDGSNLSALDSFLYNKGFNSSSEFMTSELNSGLYPKPRLKFNYSNIEEFMHAKYPNGVAMKDFTGQYPELEKEMNEKYVAWINSLDAYPDWTDETHVVNTTFRGPVTFYGVFNDTIEFSIEKKDLNWYNGSDDVLIKVSDYYGNNIVNWTMPDDGETGVNKSYSNSFTKYKFKTNINSSSSIYYKITINEINSYNSDYLIKTFLFNSNKIITIGNILPMDNLKLYYDGTGTISVFYWHKNKNQEIIMDNQSIKLSKYDINKNVYINLDKSKSIELTKGDLWIRGGKSFSFWNNGWFEQNVKTSLFFNKKTDINRKGISKFNMQNLTINGQTKTKINNIQIKWING